MAHAETVTKDKVKIKKPGMFKVVFNNDNKTPMEFVIEVLMIIFHHDRATAEHITMDIHTKGKGTAGVYTYEVAEQKTVETTSAARQHSFPLTVSVEPE
jgi:ATP-dependent Clp protease adaptor protein ClpS